jgi:hypothetical protein
VFRTLADELGALAARYPDGEAGDRIYWIRWQRHVAQGARPDSIELLKLCKIRPGGPTELETRAVTNSKTTAAQLRIRKRGNHDVPHHSRQAQAGNVGRL